MYSQIVFQKKLCLQAVAGSCCFQYGHVTALFVTLTGQNLLLAFKTHAISSLSEKLIAKTGFITLWSKVIMH